jgi:tyrosyl-tRNA synthetase
MLFHMAHLLDDLEARGLVHDTTDRDALHARLERGPVALYHGIDPTADSLHVGNLIGLLMLRRFSDAGHRAVALAGGATGMVGDPSGRSDERNLLDEATLRANVAAIKAQIRRILGDDGRWELVDNLDWTSSLGLLEFLREVGKHATVNQMIARESVRTRMDGDQGISFTEFSYMLLQANDYRWLHEHRGVELQIGGSDQWGNILSGVDLIRRSSGTVVHALCWPLLLGPDGSKLGKSTGGRIWLDPARTSPYQFFQHWMSIDDALVQDHLARFTLLPVEDVRAAADDHAAAPERRVGQRLLAREVTTLVHGAEEAELADSVSSVLFGGSSFDEATFAALGAEVPTTTLPAAEVEGRDLAELAAATGLCGSKSEAQRLVAQGGLYVNNERPAAPQVGDGDLRFGRYLLLRRGKANYHLVVARSS